MGTEYNLYKDDSVDNSFELTIDEMSNKLSFNFDSGALYNVYESSQMTSEEMAKVFLKGLTVCSYWMDTDELKALIQDHVDKEIY